MYKRRKSSLGAKALGMGIVAAGWVAAVSLINTANAEDNGVALKPQMGWSTWSFIRRNPTESNFEAQALAMHNNLQSHGFKYVNLDDFWYLDPRVSVDEYGRWAVDTTKFPDGMAAIGRYIHSLGLKFGMYVTPGIPVAAYNQNTPIEGTKYHAQDIADTSRFETNYNFGGNVMYYIDFSKPGAQQYINSWARLFASWGVDYIKIDAVGTQNVSDIQAWSEGLIVSGRRIHLALSNSLDVNYGATWREYSNSWRISGDVEAYLGSSSYPLTNWTNVLSHFLMASQWTQFSGPGGWNDPDSLEIGNGSNDGTNAGTSPQDFFTQDQRQSLMTYWTIIAAPLLLGTDLTNNLDSFDYTLLQNDEVIAVDQAGVQGSPVFDYYSSDSQGAMPEIWRSKQPDGSYAVVLTNPSAKSQSGTADWSVFGVGGNVIVRDLWSKSDLVANANLNGGYAFGNSASFNLGPYQSKFLKVTPLTPVTQYLADAPVNTLTGSAVLSNKNTATHGRAAGYVGNGGSITFNKVHVDQAGVYNIGILFFNGEVSRPGTISVNNGTPMNVTFPGTGSFSTLGTVTQSLSLIAGDNSIAISAPGNSYAPDLDSIVVPSQTTRYLADGAQLKGSNIKIINAVNCTDGHCVSEIGKTNTLIFDKVTVAAAGVHHVTILYLTDVDRSAELTVNWSTPIKVEFPSTSGVANNNNVVGAVSVDLPLRQGTNNITVSNPKTWTPDLDSIIVAQ